MNKKALLACFIAGVFTSGALTDLRAQPTNRFPARAGRPGQLPAAAMGRFGPGYDRLMGVLTEEQRASLRVAMEDQRDKVRGLEEKLRNARKELFEAGLTQKFDEEAVHAKAMEAAKIDAEMTVLRVKAFSQMQPPLSAEQLEKLKNLAPGGGENRPEPERSRPDVKRDENGLPLKKQPLPVKPPEE